MCSYLTTFQGLCKPHQNNYHSVAHKLLTLLNQLQIYKQEAREGTSVAIKKHIYKDTDNQVHIIKYTYRLAKGSICVEVKLEEQKNLLISKANILTPGCVAKSLSSLSESLITVKTLSSLISTGDIREDFKRSYQTSCSVCRFHANSNKKTLAIISTKTKKKLLLRHYQKKMHTSLIKDIFVKFRNNLLFVASTVKDWTIGLITIYQKCL